MRCSDSVRKRETNFVVCARAILKLTDRSVRISLENVRSNAKEKKIERIIDVKADVLISVLSATRIVPSMRCQVATIPNRRGRFLAFLSARLKSIARKK